MASFTVFSSLIANLDRDSWTFPWIWIFCFRFSFLYSFSFFLFCLWLKNPFSLKLWVVCLIILGCLLFLVPPTRRTTGWTFCTYFMNSPSLSSALLAIVKIILSPSLWFVSSIPSFWRPVTTTHNLREYWSDINIETILNWRFLQQQVLLS